MANLRNTDWYRRAKDLPVGSKFRMAHEGCSIGDTLQVSVKREGVFAYCHLCHEPYFVPAEAMSLAQKAALLAAQEGADKVLERSKAMPLPKTLDPSEWPLDARVWVYKAGITNAEIIRQGLYYHKPSNRVVIPICDNGQPTGFWQARSVNGKPKYLNPSGFNRAYIVQSLPDVDGNFSGDTVLVEDWLSCYRVNRATGLHTIALLGTSISDPIAARLIETAGRVYCWFDNDRAGNEATTAIRKRLQAFGLDACAIRSKADPKKYSDNEIRGILHEFGNRPAKVN